MLVLRFFAIYAYIVLKNVQVGVALYEERSTHDQKKIISLLHQGMPFLVYMYKWRFRTNKSEFIC